MVKDSPTRSAFPSNGLCECGANSWYDVETGYTRMSSAEFEDGALSVFIDGWDDMSEDGDDHYVECQLCSRQYALPDSVDYN